MAGFCTFTIFVLDPDLDPDLDPTFIIQICIVSDPEPDLDPDSGGLLDPDSESGSGSRSKLSNNNNIILLFSDFYNILSSN